ncbi:MAG: FRG domain-containing protein [Pseudomonadota bacterium]
MTESKTKLESIKLTSFSDFADWVEMMRRPRRQYLYRGQSVRGGLLPGIARKSPNRNKKIAEKEALKQFALLGASLLPVGPQSQVDLMVIAQHHGLKTRLLDWSANPLVALLFACAATEEGDVYVYVLDATDLMDEEVYQSDPFDRTNTAVFQPRLNNPRVAAQDGWFTLHAYAKGNSKFIALERITAMKGMVKEIIIPLRSRERMLEMLQATGFTARSMFPDLEGLSRYLNLKHQFTEYAFAEL